VTLISISEAIEQIRSGKWSGKQIAEYPAAIGRSYVWHPLGFLMAKVLEEPPLTLRVHIWPKYGGREQDPAWPIHDHIFDMKSWIIKGRLKNVLYRESENLPNFQMYLASYEGNESVLNRTGLSLALQKEGETAYEAGQFYTVDAGVFHSSLHEQGSVAVTAVLTKSVLTAPPRIAGARDGLGQYRYRRSIASKEEVSTVISQL